MVGNHFRPGAASDNNVHEIENIKKYLLELFPQNISQQEYFVQRISRENIDEIILTQVGMIYPQSDNVKLCK